MSQTQKIIELNGRKITLIGTAHVSKESIEEVKQTINELNPDCVAIELDSQRADSIKNADKYKNLDIIKILKKNEGFLLIANLILASFQRRMGANVGVKPGDEMLAALSVAEEKSIRTTLVDRPIQITLKRAWGKNTFFGKCKLLGTLLSSAFSKEEIESDQIEKLKNTSEMDNMMKELSDYMPVIKEVLIDERDKYLASKIYESEGSNIVAVLGAGHLPGVEAHLHKIANAEESSNVDAISEIPKKTFFSKIVKFIIPAIIIGLIAAGFIYGGVQAGKEALSIWFLYNGIPSALLTILALAHPVTILTALVTAPFTSLCPFIGVGFVTGIVQAILCKPKVCDIETLQDDVSSFKGWYKNRILRILLVFILSSLGSTIGTFAGGAEIIQNLAGKFIK
ncbi:MAG: TraB/GumN family protein [Treponema sp.]|nr:TraB/GumN family protein [Treponema sp.]